MLKSLGMRNFTAFGKAELQLAKGLNVFVGENGTGKTHLLILLYAVLATSAEGRRRGNGSKPVKAFLQRDGVAMQQGDRIDDVDPLVALDEELRQSDRFLDSTAEATS